jgi:nucleoside-diphosphate-sugar epimerase
MNKKRILITGVNGSMGNALARYFAGLKYVVYGSIRMQYPNMVLPIDQDKIILIDLSRDEEYQLPEHVDAVIHCAAATSESSVNTQNSTIVNVDGTYRLIQACKKAGVKQLIYISTMSANPDNPSSYAQTKLGAERVLEEEQNLDHVILRPGLVISSSSRGIFAKMTGFVNKLPLIPIIGNKANLATISMNELCRAVELTIGNAKASRLKIDVCANECLSIKQIVKLIAIQSGRKVICITIPYSLALLIAKISNLLKLSLLSKDNVYGLQYARVADTTFLRTVLGLDAKKFEQSLANLSSEHGKETYI